MKKISIKNIFDITKDILTKSCIYFTAITLTITPIAVFLNTPLNPGTYLMFALSALGAGVAVQVFKIGKIPVVSRHIAFFILLYLTFLLVFVPLSAYSVNADTTLYLSVAFIVIYLVVLGIVMGTKAVINSVRNKKLKYEKQFENVKNTEN